eukprot:1613091-Amphidinium_carterae.1
METPSLASTLDLLQVCLEDFQTEVRMAALNSLAFVLSKRVDKELNARGLELAVLHLNDRSWLVRLAAVDAAWQVACAAPALLMQAARALA